MDYYELARGPLVWAAFICCIGGIVFRLAIMLAGPKKLNRMHPQKSVVGGAKSTVRGMLPFALHYMREHPVFTLITFVFHLCVLVTPAFLLAHIVLFYESWKIQWSSLPDGLADVMSFIAIAGVLFFAGRRLISKEVKWLSGISDWVLLVVVTGVFISGIAAGHHWGPYRPLLIAHVFLGEMLLVMIPFSKLFHMVLFFFTRGYLGAEYEIVLDGKGL